jgi:hypothetical protein
MADGLFRWPMDACILKTTLLPQSIRTCLAEGGKEVPLPPEL